MNDRSKRKSHGFNQEIPRRNFLVVAGAFLVSASIGSCTSTTEGPHLKTLDIKSSKDGIPVCRGYILVDPKKCQGCMTCMLACSLVHEGKENLSLARIQIVQNPFGKYPNDLAMEQCRQCVDPACLKACPEEALMVDIQQGNVRRIDAERCIGCMNCVEACPYNPGRVIWNFHEDLAQKCDLCLDTPHWKRQGGSTGRQACIESCPLGAIMFSEKVPLQEGNAGYEVNLRGKGWEKLGYTAS